MNTGCYLNSTNTSLPAGRPYTPKNEAEEAELLQLAKAGTCSVLPEPGKAPEAAPEAPAPAPDAPEASDLADVPGIGKTTLDKLAKAGVTSKAQLKAALTARADEMKALLGMNFDKVSKFVTAEK